MRGFKRDILYSFHIINRERVPEVSQCDVCFQSKHIYRIRNKLNNEYKYWITQSAKLRAKHSQKVYKLHWIQNIYQKKKNCGGEKTAKLCCWESKKEREKKCYQISFEEIFMVFKKIYGFVFLSQNDPYNNLILFVSKGISKKRKFIYSFFSSALF